MMVLGIGGSTLTFLADACGASENKLNLVRPFLAMVGLISTTSMHTSETLQKPLYSWATNTTLD